MNKLYFFKLDIAGGSTGYGPNCRGTASGGLTGYLYGNCTACPAGTTANYANTFNYLSDSFVTLGAIACTSSSTTACPAGSGMITSYSGCYNCPANTYNPGNSLTCKPCESGSFTNSNVQSSAILASKCTVPNFKGVCPAGSGLSFTNVSAPGCYACDPYVYQTGTSAMCQYGCTSLSTSSPWGSTSCPGAPTSVPTPLPSTLPTAVPTPLPTPVPTPSIVSIFEVLWILT